MSELLQLEVPLQVIVVSGNLPKGVVTSKRRGTAIAWWMNEESCQWLVVFDETGELVWVPMREVRLRSNWSAGRRY